MGKWRICGYVNASESVLPAWSYIIIILFDLEFKFRAIFVLVMGEVIVSHGHKRRGISDTHHQFR